MWRESPFTVLWMLVVMPFVLLIPTSRIVYFVGVEPLFRATVVGYAINLALIIGMMTLLSRLHDKRSRP